MLMIPYSTVFLIQSWISLVKVNLGLAELILAETVSRVTLPAALIMQQLVSGHYSKYKR